MRRSSFGFGVQRRTALAALLAGALTGLAAEAARAQDVPFQATVIEDKTEVLAGGSRKLYVVGHLNKGAVVTVREVIEGYNRISPPSNVYSYVSKAFVDAKGDGKSGVVSADHAKVLAASVNGPGESYKWQLDLAKGAVVQIVGDDASFYKIVPPEGTSVYLPPGAVRRVEAPKPTPTAPPEVKPDAPVKPIAAEPAKPAPKPAEPKPVAPPAPVKPPEAKPVEAKPAEVKPVEAKPAAMEVKSEAPKVVEAKPAETVKPVEAVKPAEVVKPVEPMATAAPAEVKPAEVKPEAPKPTVPPPVSADARPVNPAPTPTPAPVAVPAPVPAPVAVKPAEPVKPTEPPKPAFVPAKAITPAINALEARLAAAQAQPLEKQPLADLLAGYEKAAATPDLPVTDRRIVMNRTAQLKRSIEIQGALTSLSQTGSSVGGPITIPATAKPTPGVYSPTKYDIVGQLLASGVYDGDTGPRLYRVVEPATMRTIAYVLQGKFDPAQSLGRIVGINGAIRYDPALKLNVIEVTKIEPLEAAASQPSK